MFNASRILSILLILAGLLLLVASAAVDIVGLSKPGFGPKQVMLALVGLVTIIAGIGLALPVVQQKLANNLLLKVEPESRRKVTPQILTISLWFGLLAGLVEGLGFLLLLTIGKAFNVWVEIVWISTIFDTLFFGAIGLGLAIVSSIFPRLRILPISVFVFVTLTLSSWLRLALSGRGVHEIALLILSFGGKRRSGRGTKGC